MDSQCKMKRNRIAFYLNVVAGSDYAGEGWHQG